MTLPKSITAKSVAMLRVSEKQHSHIPEQGQAFCGLPFFITIFMYTDDELHFINDRYASIKCVYITPTGEVFLAPALRKSNYQIAYFLFPPKLPQNIKYFAVFFL